MPPPQQAPPGVPQGVHMPPAPFILPEQVRPPWQVWPFSQQGWLAPPQAAHMLSVPQVVAGPQELPLQQGWLGPPQATQLFAEHRNPAAHVAPAQQACPLPPHVPQVPLAQTSPVTLQVVPQHG